MNDFDSDITDKSPEHELETESAGDGGNRLKRTAVGAGGGSRWGAGGGSSEDFEGRGFFGEPVRHGHLKDIAIDVLSQSHSKNYSDVRARLLGRFIEKGDDKEAMADILSSMVVSAYTVAYLSNPKSEADLKAVCPYFSARQIERILSIAMFAS
jgi:hypothetical protein